MSHDAYPGTELEIFAGARNWKRYLARSIGPWLGERVLEVGAGLGATTRALWPAGGARRWVCLEPDRELAARLAEDLAGGELPAACEVIAGVVGDLAPAAVFDTTLYIDVLEHIRDDRDELRAALARLAPGGALVVLAPAHPWLFSPFDTAVGHHRRYTKRSLLAIAPPGLALERARYLDSAGLLASAGNRLLLRRAEPGAGLVGLWDRYLVPVSRFLDPATGWRLGRSLLVVWRKPAQGGA